MVLSFFCRLFFDRRAKNNLRKGEKSVACVSPMKATQHSILNSSLAKAEQQFPNTDLVAVTERLRLAGSQLLAVQQRAVGAVHVLDQHLTTLDKQAYVPPADAVVDRAIGVQIDLGEKVADRIATADDRLGRIGQRQR